MRYFTICYPNEHNETVWETLSEEDIRKEYYPYWYEKMCDKYGKEHVDATYSFEECLEDWQIVHWSMRNYWREMKENFQ